MSNDLRHWGEDEREVDERGTDQVHCSASSWHNAAQSRAAAPARLSSSLLDTARECIGIDPATVSTSEKCP